MNTKDFIRLGIPLGEATRRATDFVSSYILAGGDKARLEEELKTIIAHPSAFVRDDLRGEVARVLLNAPPPPRAEPVNYRQCGEGLEHEAVTQMSRACLLPSVQASALSCGSGFGSDLGRELFNLCLQAPHFFQRTFSKDGELLWLRGKQLTAQCAKSLAHQLQLLDGLDQCSFRVGHSTTRSSPLRAPGIPRTRLKNSTYFLYSAEPDSATNVSKPNLRRKRLREISQ